MYKKLFLILLIIASKTVLNAQVKMNYNNSEKISLEGKFKAKYEIKAVEITPPDLKSALERDKREVLNGSKILYIAEPIASNLDVAKLCSWVVDGNNITGKFTLKAKDAKSLSINFSDFYLPNGTEMYIYSKDGEMITGVITELENNKNKIWGSPVYKGEELNIEIRLPTENKAKLNLVITNVAYGYKNIFMSKTGGFGASQPCHFNVLCPEGNGWEGARNSVAHFVSSDGSIFWSGMMIMNTCSTNIPYVLTANHCFIGDNNVAGWRVQFQAWSATCTPSQNSDGIIFNGTTLKARWAESDFCLVQLNQTPKPNSGITYAGWSRSLTPATSGASLHHPQGDVMKISRYFTPLQRIDNGNWTVGGITRFAPGIYHWRVQWQTANGLPNGPAISGVTEGGSSGSPLFDQNGRVVGQLAGGPSSCVDGDVKQDYYGRFDNSWTGGGTPSTRLSDWLDPNNTNTMATNTTNMASLANISSTISGPSTICSGALYSISSLPVGATINWVVTGALAITSGQNTSTIGVTGYDRGTIQAIITYCGTSYPTAPFNVSVNLPPGLGVNYTYNTGSSIPLSLSNTNNLCLGYTSRGYLIATISSGTVTFTAISGLTIAYRDGRSAYFTLSPGASVGRVRVSSSNGCGSETQEMAFQIVNCGTPSYPGDPNPTDPCNIQPRLYNISPNPASEQIKIGIAVGTSERPIEIVCPINPKIQAMIYSKEGITFSEVNIYNSFGILVLSYQTNKAKEFVIPLKTLKTGLYLVQISEGEHVERHQIIIE